MNGIIKNPYVSKIMLDYLVRQLVNIRILMFLKFLDEVQACKQEEHCEKANRSQKLIAAIRFISVKTSFF